MVCEIFGNKFLQTNELLPKFIFSNCSSRDEGSNFKSIKHSKDTTVAYNSLICKLLDNRVNGNVNLRELTLSKEASELCSIYFGDTLGKYKTTVMMSAFIERLATNFDEHLLRIAGILAICADKTEIDGETIKNAIKISDWFLESAFSLYMDNSDIFKSDIE
jgi:hypothetical protein